MKGKGHPDVGNAVARSIVKEKGKIKSDNVEGSTVSRVAGAESLRGGAGLVEHRGARGECGRLKGEWASLAEHMARGKGSIARALYRESTTLARALEQMEVSIVARRAALAKRIAEDPFLEAMFSQ